MYLERRILEEVFGRQRVDMEATLDRQALAEELARLEPPDQILHVDLSGRDPDDAMTQVPYLKGDLFLRLLEETVGRKRFDTFLRAYFDRFAFRSITTSDFVAYLNEQLLSNDAAQVERLQVGAWLEQPGLPTNAPRSESDALTRVEQQAARWAGGKTAAAALDTGEWTTQERVHFLKSVPERLTAEQMTELDEAFVFTDAGNSEVVHQWLLIAIRNEYEPAYDRLETYLVGIGRRKLIKPLYDELVKTPEGRARAEAIYDRARPGYHPISVSVDRRGGQTVGRGAGTIRGQLRQPQLAVPYTLAGDGARLVVDSRSWARSRRPRPIRTGCSQPVLSGVYPGRGWRRR